MKMSWRFLLTVGLCLMLATCWLGRSEKAGKVVLKGAMYRIEMTSGTAKDSDLSFICYDERWETVATFPVPAAQNAVEAQCHTLRPMIQLYNEKGEKSGATSVGKDYTLP